MNVLIAKTHVVAIDEAKFSPEVTAFIFAYGVKQLLNDAGSAGKGAAEKLAMANKKLDALYAGTLRAAKADAIPQADKLAQDFALRDVKKVITKACKKVADFDKVKLAEMVKKVMDKNAAHYAKLAAEEIVRLAAVAEASGDIDLDGLLG